MFAKYLDLDFSHFPFYLYYMKENYIYTYKIKSI